MAFLWVMIYLVAGFGAYWLTFKEGLYIREALVKRFGDKADDVYADYRRKTQFDPEIHSVSMYVVLLIVIIIGVWWVWPIFAIGGGIYEWFVYRHVCKVWSEKLRFE